MPSDIDYVVKRSKRLESRLKDELNAEGDGLGNRANSVKEQLPPETYQLLRKVADIRNDIVHKEGRDKLESKREFARWCDEIEESLDGLQRPGCAPTECLSWGFTAMALCILCTIVIALFQNPH
jgi:hypothetical protein